MQRSINSMCMVCRNFDHLSATFIRVSPGPGGFFKSHVDTPRSSSMFGSLVVVLPTVHEGGSLLIRHGGKTWTFETAKTVETGHRGPKASFVAFFSDVEHEVMPVISGYRVTLTFNLFTESTGYEEAAVPTFPETKGIELEIKDAVADLLDSSIMERGGYIGFGLSYKYPFQHRTTQMSEIRLKGIDAAIQRACASLSLRVELKIYYADQDDPDRESADSEAEEGVLMDKFIPIEDYGQIEDSLIYRIRDFNGGKVVWDVSSGKWRETMEGDLPIIWVKPLVRRNGFTTPYVVHGNEPMVGHAYCELCLIASPRRGYKDMY